MTTLKYILGMIALGAIIIIYFLYIREKPEPIILDSNYTLNEAVSDKIIPENVKNEPHPSELEPIIVDSNYTLEEAVSGIVIPDKIKKSLSLVDVRYHSFDDREHRGQLLVDESVAQNIKRVFEGLFELNFPIEKAVPIVAYGWDDEASMQDNNTSAFNYRFVKGTEILSNHSYGRAVDINPLLNPYVKGSVVQPQGAKYIPARMGTILDKSPIVQLFEDAGWIWGGHWQNLKDYQHFEIIGSGTI